jgi:hypothetical protein
MTKVTGTEKGDRDQRRNSRDREQKSRAIGPADFSLAPLLDEAKRAAVYSY